MFFHFASRSTVEKQYYMVLIVSEESTNNDNAWFSVKRRLFSERIETNLVTSGKYL